MSRSVAERRAETVARQPVPGRRIDGEPRPPGLDRCDRPIVRFEDRGVDFPGPLLARPTETVRVRSTQYES